MNVGILSAAPFPPRSPEGISNYVYNLACKLTERGHNVTIITRGSTRKLDKDEVHIMDKNVKVSRVPIISMYPFHVHIHGIFVRELIRLLESELDIIHAHSPYIPAISSSLPVLTTIHSLEKVNVLHYEEVGLRSLAYKMSSNIFFSMELKLFRNSDMLTAVSKHVLNDLKSVYGLEREGIVIGNGVDEKSFTPLHKSQDTGYILYAGRVDYGKGLFDLLESAKYVCKEERTLSFVLVGDGPLVGMLSKKAEKMGIREKIIFAGYADKTRIARLYQNATVFVLPSYYEGLSTVILEAMSCAVPVVATNIGGNVDVISHGVNGFLVSVRSPKQIANYILKLANDEELRRKIGAESRKTIEKEYTWDKVADRVLSCYESLSQHNCR